MQDGSCHGSILLLERENDNHADLFGEMLPTPFSTSSDLLSTSDVGEVEIHDFTRWSEKSKRMMPKNLKRKLSLSKISRSTCLSPNRPMTSTPGKPNSSTPPTSMSDDELPSPGRLILNTISHARNPDDHGRQLSSPPCSFNVFAEDSYSPRTDSPGQSLGILPTIVSNGNDKTALLPPRRGLRPRNEIALHPYTMEKLMTVAKLKQSGLQANILGIRLIDRRKHGHSNDSHNHNDKRRQQDSDDSSFVGTQNHDYEGPEQRVRIRLKEKKYISPFPWTFPKNASASMRAKKTYRSRGRVQQAHEESEILLGQSPVAIRGVVENFESSPLSSAPPSSPPPSSSPPSPSPHIESRRRIVASSESEMLQLRHSSTESPAQNLQYISSDDDVSVHDLPLKKSTTLSKRRRELKRKERAFKHALPLSFKKIYNLSDDFRTAREHATKPLHLQSDSLSSSEEEIEEGMENSGQYPHDNYEPHLPDLPPPLLPSDRGNSVEAFSSDDTMPMMRDLDDVFTDSSSSEAVSGLDDLTLHPHEISFADYATRKRSNDRPQAIERDFIDRMIQRVYRPNSSSLGISRARPRSATRKSNKSRSTRVHLRSNSERNVQAQLQFPGVDETRSTRKNTEPTIKKNPSRVKAPSSRYSRPGIYSRAHVPIRPKYVSASRPHPHSSTNLPSHHLPHLATNLPAHPLPHPATNLPSHPLPHPAANRPSHPLPHPLPSTNLPSHSHSHLPREHFCMLGDGGPMSTAEIAGDSVADASERAIPGIWSSIPVPSLDTGFQDRCLRTIYVRCFTLLKTSDWFDLPTIVDLFRLFDSRKLANLDTEHQNGYPDFWVNYSGDFPLSLEDKDTTFEVLLKILYLIISRLLKDENVETANSTKKELMVFLSKISPTRVLSYPSTLSYMPQERSMLTNHCSLILLFMHSMPRAAKSRINQLRSVLKFTETDVVSRLRYIQSIHIAARICRKQAQSQEPIVAWCRDLITINTEEIARLQLEREKTVVPDMMDRSGVAFSNNWITERTRRKLDVGIENYHRVIEALLNTVRDILTWDEGTLEWISFFDANWTKTLLSMQSVVKQPELCISVMQVMAQSAKAWERLYLRSTGQMEIQDDFDDSLEFSDSDFTALMDVEGVSLSQSCVTTQAATQMTTNIAIECWKFAEYLRDEVSPRIYQVLSNLFGDAGNAAKKTSSWWLAVDCTLEAWIASAKSLVKGKLREWSCYVVAYGTESYKRFIEPIGRRYAAIFFLTEALAADKRLFDEHKDQIIDTWFATILDNSLTLQHVFTQQVFEFSHSDVIFSPNVTQQSDFSTLSCLEANRILILDDVFRNMGRTGVHNRARYLWFLGSLLTTCRDCHMAFKEWEAEQRKAYASVVHIVLEMLERHCSTLLSDLIELRYFRTEAFLRDV